MTRYFICSQAKKLKEGNLEESYNGDDDHDHDVNDDKGGVEDAGQEVEEEETNDNDANSVGVRYQGTLSLSPWVVDDGMHSAAVIIVTTLWGEMRYYDISSEPLRDVLSVNVQSSTTDPVPDSHRPPPLNLVLLPVKTHLVIVAMPSEW